MTLFCGPVGLLRSVSPNVILWCTTMRQCHPNSLRPRLWWVVVWPGEQQHVGAASHQPIVLMGRECPVTESTWMLPVLFYHPSPFTLTNNMSLGTSFSGSLLFFFACCTEHSDLHRWKRGVSRYWPYQVWIGHWNKIGVLIKFDSVKLSVPELWILVTGQNKIGRKEQSRFWLKFDKRGAHKMIICVNHIH